MKRIKRIAFGLYRVSSTFSPAVASDTTTNVDEGVFGFKGRHRARCYNPNKPEKWHFKSYCLNCSVTGYLVNFFMYQGRDEKVLLPPSEPPPPSHSNHCFEQSPPGQTASEYPVLRLLEPNTFNSSLEFWSHYIDTLLTFHGTLFLSCSHQS